MTSAFLSSPLLIVGLILNEHLSPEDSPQLPRSGTSDPTQRFQLQIDAMSGSAPMASADRKDIPDEGTDLSAVKEAAYSLGETLEEVVNERPLVALGVALGVGLLLGMTWRRR